MYSTSPPVVVALFFALNVSGEWQGDRREAWVSDDAAADCSEPLPQPVTHVRVFDRPFDPLPTSNGCWIFVSTHSDSVGHGLSVLSKSGGSVSQAGFIKIQGQPFGMVLSRDETTLIVAAWDRVAVLDVKSLISGGTRPLQGYLSDSTFNGTIHVNLTSDDRYLFVSQERGNAITVVDFDRARESAFAGPAIIGAIPTGRAPISLVFSPDQRYLYATVQEAEGPITCKPQQNRTASPDHPEGVILLIDVERAKLEPQSSVLASIRAGCNPVRLVLSRDGERAYVTARTDDVLLIFDTNRFLSNPQNALIARVPVGVAPVGVTLSGEGTQVIVANSNRFAGGPQGGESLTIVDATRVSEGAAATLGTLPAGGFPRQLRVTHDDRTLLIANYNSGTVQIVDLGRLPDLLRR